MLAGSEKQSPTPGNPLARSLSQASGHADAIKVVQVRCFDIYQSS